jgi:vacuole morphology and inheritance protein 14
LKDIVSEVAATYVPIWAGANNPNLPSKTEPTSKMASLAIDDTNHDSETLTEAEAEREGKKAFSLARFIPLLSERIYVISPYARMHLISWLMVLDSVPDLELVAWLPEILDGILYVLFFFSCLSRDVR